MKRTVYEQQPEETGETATSVIVRPYRESDFDALVRLTMKSPWFRSFNDESCMSIIRSAVHAEYIESGDEQYSVIRCADDVYCGNISLKKAEDDLYELGISLYDTMQNQGIGTQALRQFCSYCYHEKGLRCLLVRIHPENTRSIHVFEKLGAVYKTKKAQQILLNTYAILGKPVPDDLDETAGVLHYYLHLPLTEQPFQKSTT